jgi:hypothetical protein
MPPTAEAYKRYLKKFDEQEDWYFPDTWRGTRATRRRRRTSS